MYDAIVVGARVAGAGTALRLARAGHRVLLVDRARFPSDTLSTHYVHQTGVARLAAWGVLDDVVATGCPPLERAVYQVGDVRLAGCSLPVDGRRAAYAPRRQLLDHLLVKAAVAAGAEFREACPVSEVVVEDGRAVGVRCRSASGRQVTERARLVVGADGMRSRVAAAVGAPVTAQDPLKTCVYYTYWQGVQADFELYECPGHWVGTVPTNDGATLVAAYLPQAEFDRVRGEALTHYLDNIRFTAPSLAERLESAERVERLRGTGAQQNFFRQAAGPGWALVGDAAHHKDSITARGISDAFQQVDLLADLIGHDLAERPLLDAALEKYAAVHQDTLFESYQGTLIVSELHVPEERMQVLRALQSSQTLTDRYFTSVAGALSMEDLYTEELLALLP
jgi:2-polyprenyl-6-methoxyphenol hydroxylase-like FAD-dependent oxidoreductase